MKDFDTRTVEKIPVTDDPAMLMASLMEKLTELQTVANELSAMFMHLIASKSTQNRARNLPETAHDDALTVTVEQAAKLMNRPKYAVYNLCHIDGFPSHRQGRRIMINRAGLQEWIDQHDGCVIETAGVRG